MARYRHIYIKLWQDPCMLKYTKEMKLFFLYLLSNPYTKQCGIYELPLELASVESGFTTEELEGLIEKFTKLDKVKFNPKTREIAIKNWGKYNINDNPNIRKCVAHELKEVKDKSLIEYASLNGFKLKNVKKTKKTNKVIKEEKKDYGDGVMMTKGEYSKLINRFGKAEVKDKMEDFANYEKRDKYKNHYATILNWLKKDVKVREREVEENYEEGSHIDLRKELAE